ncbi:MAG: hypothetical protein IPM22_09100 [Betaproteobacteria bacterium]|nr:hypothetical protein [Betaproteobacteria bacterium]
MSRILSTIGILATLAYVAFLAWAFGGRLAELRSLEPNHIGDFLAGAFGPLAILWLILGFFQQGMELRENSRALDLQAAELKSATREQRELLQILRGQLEATRAEVAIASRIASAEAQRTDAS